MKLSVIVPCHNAKETLPAALRSIEIASEGLDVETVVIDDPEGRGPSWARNRGLDKAAGDVVFFVDADDTVEPDDDELLISMEELGYQEDTESEEEEEDT